MASGNGTGAASGDGKRKRGKGSGSGLGQAHPGDPPTHTVGVLTEEPAFTGVRARVTVEIKGWGAKDGDGKSRDFFLDVKLPKDLEMRKVVAAIIHDLARLYWNPEYPVKSLNIRSVELWIRKQDRAEELCIGKDLLVKYVRDYPLTTAPGEWVGLVTKKFTALKDEIAKRGREFFEVLKDAIAKESSRAGCKRQEEDELFPALKGGEPSENSEKEVQRLMDQIASLEVTHAAKDAEIATLKEELLTARNSYLFDPSLPRSPTSGLM